MITKKSFMFGKEFKNVRKTNCTFFLTKLLNTHNISTHVDYNLWVKFPVGNRMYCYCFEREELMFYERFLGIFYGNGFEIRDISKDNMSFHGDTKECNDGSQSFYSLKIGQCFKWSQYKYIMDRDSRNRREDLYTSFLKLSNKKIAGICYAHPNCFSFYVYHLKDLFKTTEYITPVEGKLEYRILI